jgi:hypothetical protein
MSWAKARHLVPRQNWEKCLLNSQSRPVTRTVNNQRSVWLWDAEQAFLFAVCSRASGLRGVGVACRVMEVGTACVAARAAGQCAGVMESLAWCAWWSFPSVRVVRRRRVWRGAALRWGTAVGPGPARLWRQAGCRVREAQRRSWRESTLGRCPWPSGVRANIKATQAGARAKINTEVTRTKRHSPARDGTAAKMSV